LYTSQRTKTMPAAQTSLLTIADWLLACRDGADPAALLEPHVAALRAHAAAGDTAWLAIVPPEALTQRLATLHGWLHTTPDRRRLLAERPLFGVPFAIKDNIDAAGWVTTAACPAFAWRADTNATVVHRLLEAGAVLVGKTNLDQFATGLVGTRSPYGAPASVFSAAHVSGGSSSGSAVVVARGEVPFALGTDTAGSGRVPAGFNGIVGLKPTPGRVGTAGVLPACRSLDCVSVLALSAAEAAAVLAVIEGPDPADPYSRFQPGAAAWPDRPLRVGVPAQPVLDAGCGYDQGWRQALQRLEALGAMAVPIDFAPLHAVADLLYQGPWVAERYAVVQALIEADPQALDAAVAEVIAAGARFSAVDTFRAQYRLREAQQALAALWQQVDLLMVPTAPRHPTHAEVAAAPLAANVVLGTYTNFVNLLGWCALALPAAMTAGGLPFGVTFIAAGGADAALAGWGSRWERGDAQPDALPDTPPTDATPALCPPSAMPALALGRTGLDTTTLARRTPVALPTPATEPTLDIAVVGAHLSGLPLNGQLTERRARLLQATTTAPTYRLYALPGTTPPKPGLQRVAEGGAAIAVEVWAMPLSEVGSFLALIPPPLGLGSLELADGRHVHGFVCEAHALPSATDITAHGGWRAYLASRSHALAGAPAPAVVAAASPDPRQDAAAPAAMNTHPSPAATG
jgi:allophanate hydrolase